MCEASMPEKERIRRGSFFVFLAPLLALVVWGGSYLFPQAYAGGAFLTLLLLSVALSGVNHYGLFKDLWRGHVSPSCLAFINVLVTALACAAAIADGAYWLMVVGGLCLSSVYIASGSIYFLKIAEEPARNNA